MTRSKITGVAIVAALAVSGLWFARPDGLAKDPARGAETKPAPDDPGSLKPPDRHEPEFSVPPPPHGIPNPAPQPGENVTTPAGPNAPIPRTTQPPPPTGSPQMTK